MQDALSKWYNKTNHFLPQNNFLLGLNLTAQNWWPLQGVKSSILPRRHISFPLIFWRCNIRVCARCDFFASYKSACQRTKCGGDGDMRSRAGSVSKLFPSELEPCFNIQSSLSPTMGAPDKKKRNGCERTNVFWTSARWAHHPQEIRAAHYKCRAQAALINEALVAASSAISYREGAVCDASRSDLSKRRRDYDWSFWLLCVRVWNVSGSWAHKHCLHAPQREKHEATNFKL